MSLESLILAKSQEAATVQGQAVEALIRVYLETTGAHVGDVELVEQRHAERDGVITITWYVRRRTRPRFKVVYGNYYPEEVLGVYDTREEAEASIPAGDNMSEIVEIQSD